MVFSRIEPDRPYRAVCSLIQTAMAEASRPYLTTIHPERRISMDVERRCESSSKGSARMVKHTLDPVNIVTNPDPV
jgi:hypothetical protein